MLDWLTNPYFASIGIPVVFLAAGVLGKKLVRGSGWKAEDFYLGIELTLGVLSSLLVHFYDIAGNATITVEDVLATAGFIAITFLLFLAVVALHQEYESSNNYRAQIIWLICISNFIGFVLMLSFVLLIKRV